MKCGKSDWEVVEYVIRVVLEGNGWQETATDGETDETSELKMKGMR